MLTNARSVFVELNLNEHLKSLTAIQFQSRICYIPNWDAAVIHGKTISSVKYWLHSANKFNMWFQLQITVYSSSEKLSAISGWNNIICMKSVDSIISDWE